MWSEGKIFTGNVLPDKAAGWNACSLVRLFLLGGIVMDKTTSLTQGNVFKTLIKFAVPVFAAMFLQSLYGGVDLLVVGQFATTADVSGLQHLLPPLCRYCYALPFMYMLKRKTESRTLSATSRQGNTNLIFNTKRLLWSRRHLHYTNQCCMSFPCSSTFL